MIVYVEFLGIDKKVKIKHIRVIKKTKSKKGFKAMLIELYALDGKNLHFMVKDTYENFIDANEEDEDVLEALEALKSGKVKEKYVPTFQGYFFLKVAE